MNELPSNRELPPLVSDESSRLYFSVCKRLLTDINDIDDSFIDRISDAERHAIYKPGAVDIFIHQYPYEDGGSLFEVVTKEKLSDDLIQTKTYGLDSFLDLSMYEHVIRTYNQEYFFEDVEAIETENLNGELNQENLDPILNGIYDFTESHLAELLSVLDSCNDSNRMR